MKLRGIMNDDPKRDIESRRTALRPATCSPATAAMSGIPSPSTAPRATRIVLTGAKGASLFDAEGSEILDLVSSWWTCTHGHSHPKINAALAATGGRVRACDVRGLHPSAGRRSRHRSSPQLLPGDLSRVFFSDDGSTSVEVALKIAYQYWINVGEPRRRVLVGFDGGYHGDTLGAMSLGRGSQFFNPFRDLMCKVYVLPFPSTFDGDDATDEREAGALRPSRRCCRTGAQTVAALIIEPLLQGAGGMRICRPSFLQRLMAIARKAGVLVIFDEVATGFGRTGTLFAMEQAGVVPDLVCLSKGLTAGYMPLAVTVRARRVFEAFFGETFDRALAARPFLHRQPARLRRRRSPPSLLFEEEKTLERISLDQQRGIARCSASFRARRRDAPRLLGSILAFD